MELYLTWIVDIQIQDHCNPTFELWNDGGKRKISVGNHRHL